MPPKVKRALAKSTKVVTKQPVNDQLQATLDWLKKTGAKRVRDGMARFAIPADKAFGITVGALRQYAKKLGPNHELALALWESGWYEARMLATFVAEPALVTPALMDRWCREFDNWAICDTACFHLFDRTAHAWSKLEPWSRRSKEFEKRAAFALHWSLSTHDKSAADAQFLMGLKLIERAADDERNFVKKAVNMALRAIGKRNPVLHDAAVATARRLAESTNATSRWVGKDALRELTSAVVTKRLAAKRLAK